MTCSTLYIVCTPTHSELPKRYVNPVWVSLPRSEESETVDCCPAPPIHDYSHTQCHNPVSRYYIVTHDHQVKKGSRLSYAQATHTSASTHCHIMGESFGKLHVQDIRFPHSRKPNPQEPTYFWSFFNTIFSTLYNNINQPQRSSQGNTDIVTGSIGTSVLTNSTS